LNKGGINLEIKAPYVDPAAVKKIEELAKKQHVSRNVFLSNLLNNYAALEEFKSYEERYTIVLDRCLNVIQRNSSALEQISRIVDDN
jgi:hypothetical protein